MKGYTVLIMKSTHVYMFYMDEYEYYSISNSQTYEYVISLCWNSANTNKNYPLVKLYKPPKNIKKNVK